jgi:hypothetical protein
VDSESTLTRANLHESKGLERRASSSENTHEAKRSHRRSRSHDGKKEVSAVHVAQNEVERDKLDDKHLKIIEDQMIQSKQAERALKRKEGDVKKEQRQVRQAVREFDASKILDLIIFLI